MSAARPASALLGVLALAFAAAGGETPAPRAPRLICHLDFNTAQLTASAVSNLLDAAAADGCDAVLWEIEDKVRWETIPSHPEAFSKDELRALLVHAKGLGLEPIPLMQTFGHAEYVLLRPGFEQLRENPAHWDCYCASNPKVRALLKRLLHEYLELFGPDVKWFHLGGDEAHQFGTCPACAARRPMELYAEHLVAVSEELRARGVRPGVWCDMMLSDEHVADAGLIPRDFVVWHWDYQMGGGGWIPPWAKRLPLLRRLGFDVVFACAAESCGDGPFLPDLALHRANVGFAADSARTNGLAGLCVTSWSIRQCPKRLQRPLFKYAARRLRRPGDPAADWRAALSESGAPSDADALDRLTGWGVEWVRYDARNWHWEKDATTPPPGAWRQAVAQTGAPDPGRLAALEGRIAAALPRVSGVWREAGELQLEMARAIRALAEGRRFAAPIARTRALFAREQAPGSADNSARVVWGYALADGPSADAPGAALEVAAAEWTKYCRAITGAPPPPAAFALEPALDAAHDEYRIVSDPATGGVKFLGANGRAVIYATYDLLERRGGCRWFWDGDVVPRRTAIDCSELDVREKARFEYRGLRYFAHRGLARFQAEHWGPDDWRREIDWCMKRRLNLMMPRIGMDDTWQKAYPELVPYPDPKAPAADGLRGFDNRVSTWGLKYRGELRRTFTDYAFARGMMIPTDFGTMTHWYSRTPVEFIEKMNPPFLPQANGNYKQRTGLVWDVFREPWLDRYWRLTEAFIDAGYGKPDLLHTIGLGERLCFDDRARNLQMKKDVLKLITARALKAHPDAKILLAGWDFYCTWEPDEVRSLLPQLDPRNTIIWDYEGEVGPGVDCWQPNRRNDFTKWGVVGKFPYVFGVFLAYEQALDVRAHYDMIEARERIAAADPMCKGYIFWPESSHTDILLLRHFTANAWRPGQSHDQLLPEFCRDRYGADAAAFERVWREILPVSQILGWGLNWGTELLDWSRDYLPGRTLADDEKLIAAVPRILGDLAAIEPKDDFQRRDAVDLARTATDRALILLRHRACAAFDGWTEGRVEAHEAERALESYLRLVRAATELLALHPDYSLCVSLDRLNAVEPGKTPDFARVLLDNAANSYCRSHQYEVAAGWYRPFAEDVVGEMLRRVAAGERKKLEDDFVRGRREARHAELTAKGIEAYRPAARFAPDGYRRALHMAWRALEGGLHEPQPVLMPRQ